MIQSIVQLLLLDNDPIFRMGLRMTCEAFSELRIVAEVETGEAALEILAARLGVDPTSADTTPEEGVDVVILELGMPSLVPTLPQFLSSNQPPAIAFCQQLKTEYPNLAVFLLTTLQQPTLLQAAQQAGVDGYCPKGISIQELVRALHQVATGQPYWVDLDAAPSPLRRVESPQPQSRGLSILNQVRDYLGRSGLQQIDETLARVTSQLPDPTGLDRGNLVELLNWLIVNGRRRELLAARWVVSHILPFSARPNRPQTPDLGENVSPHLDNSSTNPGASDALVLRGNSSLVFQTPVLATEVKSALLDITFAKLQSGLINQTGVPLEVDILRLAKKRELMDLILKKFEEMLDELRLCEVQFDQISEKCSMILEEIWAATTTDFFGKYYTLKVGQQDVEVVPVLLKDMPLVQAEILNKIPLVPELVAHLLFQMPLLIDNLSCAVGSPEAMQRSEALLQNLMIQIANGVMQPLLNHFADFEDIKQNYYDRFLLSTREIEKFRNNLSWRYRVEKYFGDPKAIFESSYNLVVLGERGFQKQVIYSPRNWELDQLSGTQLAVTLVLETRDAIAPRVRSTISFLGSGVVYLLTQVLGRGIGLIGRGILQGIGSSIQDSRFSKKK